MVAHNVVRIQGTMPGGEVWSVNPKYASATSGPVIDYAELQAWGLAIAQRIAALPTTSPIRLGMSAAASINVIRTELISPDGEMRQAAEYVFNTPFQGFGTASKPFQTAIVSTLETGRPGRSYKGRLYWPALGVALDPATLRVPTASTQAFVTDVAQLLAGISEDVPTQGAPVLSVVSMTRKVATPVNRITVGNVLDTQRRRRDSLEEGRQPIAYPPS